MLRKFSRTISLILALAIALACLSACGQGSSYSDSDGDTMYKIGVAVYDSSDPEMGIFYSYYHEYIEESFPVEFFLSDSLSSTEDVISFIEEAKEEGAGGIIAFYAPDLEEIVAACEENEIYLVLGSSSISDEEYEAVKDNEYFLGVTGPDSEEEYNAGVDMALNFISEGAGSFLILTGGAGDKVNYMHYTRALGMIETLEEELGLSLDFSADELACINSVTAAETGTDITIVICPGYLDLEEGSSNLETVFDEYDFDAVLSVSGVTSVLDMIAEEVESSEKMTYVGVIDCFSTENYEAFETIDANGNSMINYIKGKFASMVAPAFVAVFNALSGGMDVVKPDGEAFRIYQEYWTAASEAEYAKLYGYTQSIYKNAYSASDLMDVIKVYNEDASYEAFEELALSCDIDSVMERIGE